jgi:leucyl aminopeptidase (aminopeptidase T)
MDQADLVAGLTFKSLAHTRTRLSFTDGGGRYLSLPGYTETLLNDPAVTADFHSQFSITKSIAEAFSKGSRVRVATAAGTDIQLDIAGRVGNCCPGFVSADYRLGSPPDIESNVSPVEDASEGIVVVDGSVACEEIGLLHAPITLHVAGGRIRRFESNILEYVETCERLFARVGSPLAYVLAECGVGLNPAATLTGNMLTDVGVLGCVHFGFGSNATVGGLNDVPFHIDFVFRQASLWIDGQAILLDGEPVIG